MQVDDDDAAMDVEGGVTRSAPAVIDWRRDGGWNTLESMLGFAGDDGPVSFTEAMRQAAVLACVDIISQDVSKVPMRLYERLEGGGKKAVHPKDHWLAKMLALDPNSEHTWSEFFQMMTIHVVMANNAFIVKGRDAAGRVIELLPVMPGRVQININPQSFEKFFGVSRGNSFEQAMLNGVADNIPAGDMIHCRKRVVDGLNGYATLGAGGPTIRLAKTVRDYQARLFNNDGQTRLVFTQDKDMKALSPEAFDRMKRELRTAGKNMFSDGTPIMMESGWGAEMLAMSAADAEVSKVRDAQISEAARLFRVPPHKMMHFDGTKYENMDTLERLYAHDTVVPVCQSLEKPMERSLLTPEERIRYFLEFDRKEIAIVDYKIRADVLKVGLQHGSITADEFRDEFGYNPLPDGAGNIRFFQANMTVVGENNEVIVSAGAEEPTEENSKEDEKSNGGEVVRLVSKGEHHA